MELRECTPYVFTFLIGQGMSLDSQNLHGASYLAQQMQDTLLGMGCPSIPLQNELE